MPSSNLSEWKNPAILVLLIAALIAAGGTIVAAVIQSSGKPSPDTKGGSSTGQAAAPDVSSGGLLRFSGNVLLNTNGLDLDADPPQPTGSNGGDLFVPAFVQSYQLAVDPFSLGARWNSSTDGDYTTCRTAVQTQALPDNYAFENVEPGLGFCVRTSQKNIAFVRVTSESQDGFQLRVRVWSGEQQ